jgi:hypothetical protein
MCAPTVTPRSLIHAVRDAYLPPAPTHFIAWSQNAS